MNLPQGETETPAGSVATTPAPRISNIARITSPPVAGEKGPRPPETSKNAKNPQSAAPVGLLFLSL